MTMGQKVKLLRKRLGLTQKEVALKLGYRSDTSVAHIEANRDIPIDMVPVIAQILETSPAYLMGWERDPEKVQLLLNTLEKITDEQFELLLSYLEQLVKENNENL